MMETEVVEDAGKLKAGLKLIRQMKTDIMMAMTGGTQLVVEGEGPLGALMTVVEVAEQATAKELIPLIGASQTTNTDEAGWRCVVCVDFDGVLHLYNSGWKGPCDIPDEPVEGAFKWLDMMTRYRDDQDRSFQVCIYSSRSRHEGAIDAMKAWFIKHGLAEETMALLDFPTQKPAASLMIDDRAFHFQGAFPPPEWILEFKPWNKK